MPHVRILGTNHCGEIRRTAFKRRELFQDVICCRDYAERVVAIFDNKTQSEYYGGNRYVSIGCCTAHGRITFKDNKICYMCKQESLPDKSTKYTPEKSS